MATRKFKDWFDREAGLRLGKAIARVDVGFDAIGYADALGNTVADKELKARVLAMAELLRERLPDDFERAATILEGALGPELRHESGMFTHGYWLMPVARFVEEFGTNNWKASMRLCQEITKRHTGEYSVRPFLEGETERTLARMKEWAASPNPHVRRLASEGAKPRLPWAKRHDGFVNDPEPILTLVEPLRADGSPYVRKSVANLLNDVSKDHPNRVLSLCIRWGAEGDERTRWIVRHGLRSLTRANNDTAIAICGGRSRIQQPQ
ncbi:hypothetical protein ADILRU_1063 [Leifsonia rubra CMS 76R]|nr:hypothetical protein ADILRU_1063 [Leifsonia rubra CMS 76R]